MTLQFEIPQMANIDAFELKMIMAGELYEREKLSLGQAAKLARNKQNYFY